MVFHHLEIDSKFQQFITTSHCFRLAEKLPYKWPFPLSVHGFAV
jgi:hypothetical protein